PSLCTVIHTCDLYPEPSSLVLLLLFLFHPPATTEIYTLSLHDALPIFIPRRPATPPGTGPRCGSSAPATRSSRSRSSSRPTATADRKSTRLNSSHVKISYAVFCLKKKKKEQENTTQNTKRLKHQVLHNM